MKKKILLIPLALLLAISLVATGCPAPAPPPEEVAPPPKSSSDVTSNPSAYDGETVELLGQTYLASSTPRLLVDGKSGVNISGNIAGLEKGFYRLTGVYNADTNTLDVIEFIKEQVKYLAIEAGKKLGINLVPVAVEGLIATPPKEVANMLTAFISIPHFPKDLPIYPYVIYATDGFYLALSDTLVHLPTEFTFLYEGREYSFTFSAGEVKGTLVKTPLEEINFGPKWQPDEFDGVIIANTISPLDPINTTIEQVNADPDTYMFKRVSINASYIVTTATI
ncbi:hypothetical protein M1M86_01090 [Dehalococcoidales bacterium]|nr:hypothetical protein [Dehalococcoidales bacterium]